MSRFWRENGFWILTSAALLVVLVVLEYWKFFPTMKLAAWLAVALLVLVILPSGLLLLSSPGKFFQKLGARLMVWRRDLGIMVGFLVIWHGILAWGSLGGWKWSFLLLNPVIPGVVAWLIFLLLLLTSSRWSRLILAGNWKKLHQLIYLALPLMLWHVVEAGSFFEGELPLVVWPLIALVIWAGVDLFVWLRGGKVTSFRRVWMVCLGIILALLGYFFL